MQVARESQTTHFKTKGVLTNKIIASRLNLELDDSDNSMFSRVDKAEDIGIIKEDGIFEIYSSKLASKEAIEKALFFAQEIHMT